MVSTPTDPAGTPLSRADHLGFEAIWLRNAQLEVALVPALGGRMMALRFQGQELLFTNPALHGKTFSFEQHAAGKSLPDWKNYGGDKTWPAPQGWDREDQWPGPPDPYLDSGVYDVTAERDHSVTLTSPFDPRSGLQIERKITLAQHAAELTLDLKFTNLSDRHVRWAIWNVTQLDCSSEGEHWLYMASDSPPRVLFGETNPGFLDQLHEGVQPGVLGVQYRGQVGKVGTASERNWLAFMRMGTGHVLIMRARYEQGAEYPDGGCSLECWTESPGVPSPVPLASPGRLLESEVLGPLVQLEPGQSTQLSIEYNLTRLAEPPQKPGDLLHALGLETAGSTDGPP